MSKKCYPHTSTDVKVDVTQIVKYACITGVIITAIVFLTNCFHKYMDSISHTNV